MPACLTFIHENLYMHEKREPICTPIYPHRSTASRRSRLASRSTRHLGAPRCCRIDVPAGNTDRNIVDSWVSSAARLGRYTVPPSAKLGPNINLSIYLSGLAKSLGSTAGANAGQLPVPLYTVEPQP